MSNFLELDKLENYLKEHGYTYERVDHPGSQQKMERHIVIVYDGVDADGNYGTRLWVQNGHNLCVNVLVNLPSAQPDLNEWCHDCKEYDSEKHCCPRFNRVIRQAMKDAQLERKKGQWIPHHEVNMLDGSTGGVTCSVCEWSTHNKLHLLVGCPYRYCPNCGSYMEGNADE